MKYCQGTSPLLTGSVHRGPGPGELNSQERAEGFTCVMGSMATRTTHVEVGQREIIRTLQNEVEPDRVILVRHDMTTIAAQHACSYLAGMPQH